MPAIITKIEQVIQGLDQQPIIIGHSAGGAFTQILLDHGYGVAGVALNSAPTEGVRVAPPSQVKSTFPVLKSPANRHKAVGLTLEEWTYAFTNTPTRSSTGRCGTLVPVRCRRPDPPLGQFPDAPGGPAPLASSP